MFETIVMGFFIGLPLLMMLGAFIAWLYQRNQTFTPEDPEQMPTSHHQK